VKFVWRQRTTPKDSWFCEKCGKLVNKRTDYIVHDDLADHESISPFPKIIGTGTITEVSRIHMWMGHKRGLLLQGKLIRNSLDYIELAKRDGFESVDAMRDFFDRTYDIRNPKRFTVYRWDWNKPKMTGDDLLKSGIIGLMKYRKDIKDSVEYAKMLGDKAFGDK